MSESDHLIILIAIAVAVALVINALFSALEFVCKLISRFLDARLRPIVVTPEGLQAPVRPSKATLPALKAALQAYRELTECCNKLAKIPHHKPEGFSPTELAIGMARMCKFQIWYFNSRPPTNKLHTAAYWKRVEETARSGMALAKASRQKGVEIVEFDNVAGPRIIK